MEQTGKDLLPGSWRIATKSEMKLASAVILQNGQAPHSLQVNTCPHC